MSTAIATRPDNVVAMPTSERDRLVRNLILKNATDDQLKLVLAICDRYGFDPLLKHVALISGSIYVTRDGLLHVAHSNSAFNGFSRPEYDKDENGKWIVTLAVYRKDIEHPFWATAYQSEHENPNSPIWRTHGRLMTLKCAQVLGMRLAFDVSLTGVEELVFDGRTTNKGHVDFIDVTAAPTGAAPTSPSRALAAGAQAVSQPAPAAPPKRQRKDMTPEETISFIRDETQPLDRRQKAIGYLFGQAPDAEVLNAYYATIIQYADSKDGQEHGGDELATTATDVFHVRWEALNPDAPKLAPDDALDVDAVEAAVVGA